MKKIEKIHRKTKDVLCMINEFFDLAKLEAGDIALEHTRLDICEVCRNEIINYYAMCFDRMHSMRQILMRKMRSLT